jgi:flagellar hook-associated protein 3 FlgL
MTPLPLSTGLFYDRGKSQMAALSGSANLLQTQIATGKRLQAPSDDSVAYQRLQRIARDGTDAKIFDGNADLAASLLQQTDSTLQSIATEVQRASELVTRAANGTFDATARKAMGAELQSVLTSLVDLANTRDTRGQPLFGGADGAPAVIRGADGAFTFSAGAPSAIPIGDGQSVQASEPASRVFALEGTDTLRVIALLAERLMLGEALDSPESRTAMDDLATGNDQVSTVRASVGARAARVDIVQAQATAIATDREAERSTLEDTDLTTAIADMQKTMTVLSATQASFSKLSQLSLFDYLR